jgi:hypothetical protein
MRVHALLSWYDEPASSLAATVASLHGLCDSVIAVDGAYALFPDALRRPRSGPENASVITSTAQSLGMDVTVHSRSQPWLKGESDKRDFMFRLGETVSTEDDWYLLIDADEVLSQVPPDTRELLEKAVEFDAAECFMWETARERTLPNGVQIGYTSNHPIRRFWRCLRGIECGPAHHQFHVGDKWLSDAGRPRILVPALSLHDVRIEHRNVFRSDERLVAKTKYYAARDFFGIERGDEDE